jgi:hypothetical protein
VGRENATLLTEKSVESVAFFVSRYSPPVHQDGINRIEETMSEQPATIAVETPNVTNTKPAIEPVAPTATEPVKTGGKTYTEAEMEQIIKDRLAREKKASDQKADDARKAAEAEAAVKNGEWQKLAEQREKELNDAKAVLAQKDLDEKKRKIAKEVGLPDELALRIQGATDEELKADAEAVLKAIPQAQKQPGIKPLNPGPDANNNETREQAKQRLTQTSADLFKSGGGVVWPPDYPA